jgi:hypothetical protein
MGEKLIKRYSGQGKLIFEDGSSAIVKYVINEFQDYTPEGLPTVKDTRGRITHADGHPNWHPITPLHSEPYTLVMEDGSKLKVFLIDSQGSVQGTGPFF